MSGQDFTRKASSDDTIHSNTWFLATGGTDAELLLLCFEELRILGAELTLAYEKGSQGTLRISVSIPPKDV